jgi:hypothetical protein
MRTAVFAYGSLVSPQSFASTIGREPDEVIPAQLPGWLRRWSIMRDNRAHEKTFARKDGELPPWVIGLNLEVDENGEGPAPNGALIEVIEQGLHRVEAIEPVLVSDEIPPGNPREW